MKTILIADDSLSMRSLLVAAIETMDGFRVIEASSGFEALRLLPRKDVDLIITDINMPDINGLELINYVRNNPNYKDIPLFIISTESSERDLEKGLSLGANEYVVKPFEPRQILGLIVKYLGEPGGV